MVHPGDDGPGKRHLTIVFNHFSPARNGANRRVAAPTTPDATDDGAHCPAPGRSRPLTRPGTAPPAAVIRLPPPAQSADVAQLCICRCVMSRYERAHDARPCHQSPERTRCCARHPPENRADLCRVGHGMRRLDVIRGGPYARDGRPRTTAPTTLQARPVQQGTGTETPRGRSAGRRADGRRHPLRRMWCRPRPALVRWPGVCAGVRAAKGVSPPAGFPSTPRCRRPCAAGRLTSVGRPSP